MLSLDPGVVDISGLKPEDLGHFGYQVSYYVWVMASVRIKHF